MRSACAVLILGFVQQALCRPDVPPYCPTKSCRELGVNDCCKWDYSKGDCIR